MFCYPAGNSLADLHTQIAQVRRMRDLRRPQHEFLSGHFHQVDQAGIATRNLGCKTHNLPKHLIQRQFRADNPADTVQDRDFLRFLPPEFFCGHHTNEPKTAEARGPIKTFYEVNHSEFPVPA